MAHQDHRTVLRGDDPPSRLDVVRQRGSGILDDADFESLLPERVIDALPSGAVHEASMDEHDVPGIGLR
jgi:hypothetical protein